MQLKIRKSQKGLALLQCTASYPANIKHLNLNVLKTFKKHFKNCTIGLSDHHDGIDAGPIAYMLGARIFEKHFTTHRSLKGTDQSFSLEPHGMERFVRNLKELVLCWVVKINRYKIVRKKPFLKWQNQL